MNETVNSSKIDALAIASGYGDAAALARLKQAAEAGNARAQTNLGGIYSAGWGVTKDAAQALRWFRKAAEQGYANAQFSLGIAYHNGEGVPRNLIIAFALYSVAASTVYVASERNVVKKQMTPAEIDTAKALAIEMAKPGNLLAALDAYLNSKEN